jgi:hypothetical protein
MADGSNSSNSRVNIMQLILIPSVITLAVTLLRLIGELQHWPTALFKREAGGVGSIIGIVWLAFVFGAYFALKLSAAGEAPASPGRPIGFTLLGLALVFGGAFLIAPADATHISFPGKVIFGLVLMLGGASLVGRTILFALLGIVLVFGGTVFIAPADATHIRFPGKEIVGLVLMLGGAALPFLSWATLAKALIAYGYAARIPVLIIMYFSIKGNWDTHYSLGPPGVEFPGFWSKFIQIAVLPQMIFWIAFTITAGSLAGGIAMLATRRRRETAAQAA